MTPTRPSILGRQPLRWVRLQWPVVLLAVAAVALGILGVAVFTTAGTPRSCDVPSMLPGYTGHVHIHCY